MPIITAVNNLFPEAEKFWTLCEIVERLQNLDPTMDYNRVYHAFRALDSEDGLRAAVAPLSKRRPLRFDTSAARLIARGAIRRSVKDALRRAAAANGVIVEKSRAKPISTQVEPK